MASLSGSATYVTVSLMYGSVIPTWRWDSGCWIVAISVMSSSQSIVSAWRAQVCNTHQVHDIYASYVYGVLGRAVKSGAFGVTLAAPLFFSIIVSLPLYYESIHLDAQL